MENLRSGKTFKDSDDDEEFMLNPLPNITNYKENVDRIYNFNKLDKPYMQPKDTIISLEDKYYTACYLTSNLNCEHFLKNLKNRKFKMHYYDSPFHEFHVQSLFLEDIESIEVIDVDLNFDFFIHIMETKQLLNNLTKIVMRRCNINEDMLGILCPDLEYAFSLVELDLSENPFGDNGFKYILLYLYDWTALKKLILFDTQLGAKSFEALGALYLERKIFLTKLDLGRNILNKPISAKRMFSGISKQKPPLEEIYLNYCGLEGSDIASYIYNYVKHMKKLKSLDLNFNLFRTEEEAVVLGELLMESNLQLLNLSFNLLKESSNIALLDRIYSYPTTESTKTLIIENFSIPEEYVVQNPLFLERSDIIIKHAGFRKLALVKVDDLKKILVKRFAFLYKKGKPRKDLVVETIKENIPKKRLSNCKNDDFKDALLYVPSENIDPPLVLEIVAEFSGGTSRSNAALFIQLYEEISPPKKGKSTEKDVKSNGNKSIADPERQTVSEKTSVISTAMDQTSNKNKSAISSPTDQKIVINESEPITSNNTNQETA